MFPNSINDGESVDKLFRLIGRLFLSMLGRLERELLIMDRAAEQLGLVMALFINFATCAKGHGLLADGKSEVLGLAFANKKWKPHEFEKMIMAYAHFYNINLAPYGITVVAPEAGVRLSWIEINTPVKDDPFHFSKALQKYKAKKERVGETCGGNHLDITAWTAEKRIKNNGEEPLTAIQLAALREGKVVPL